MRLHGPGLGKYQESYSIDRLRRWSKQIEEWAKDLAAIYIYFDNDQAGLRGSECLNPQANGERERRPRRGENMSGDVHRIPRNESRGMRLLIC